MAKLRPLGRYGIMSTPTPRMTTHDSAEPKPATTQSAVGLDGVHRVRGAGWRISAGTTRAKQGILCRGQNQAIKPDYQ